LERFNGNSNTLWLYFELTVSLVTASYCTMSVKSLVSRLKHKLPILLRKIQMLKELERIIVERRRALRILLELPKELANELVVTAAMLLNITPTESPNWDTPYQKVFRRKPSVAHMAPIGCRACVLNRKVKHEDKLKSRMIIGYLVGHDLTNIFRIWIPSKERVIRTCNVVFERQHLIKDNNKPEKRSEEAERLIEILDIPTPQALIDIEDLLSLLQKRNRSHKDKDPLTQNTKSNAETATEDNIELELEN
jgi:hypothetical protein